jgi:hypothetical protein
MNFLGQRLTSDKIDVYTIATLGTICLIMAMVLPDFWNFAALFAGMANLVWAARLHKQVD